MIDILSHLYQYVPNKKCNNLEYIPSIEQFVLKESALVHPILFGGDQLTAARIPGAITAMANNTTSHTRLEGIVPVIEDWHAVVVLLQVNG
jgi:L1 cell adhesion molecule like protein